MSKALERLLFSQPTTAGVTDNDGVVTSVFPFLVQCTGDDEPGEVIPLFYVPGVDTRVVILSIGRRRYAIPAAS